MLEGGRPASPEDLLRLRWVSHVRLQPGAGLVAYEERWVEEDGRGYGRAIWLAPAAAEGGARRLTRGGRDWSPAWSPDGTQIAFISEREGRRSQIHVIDLQGGEARRLTDLPLGARAPRWSPDGRRLAFVATASVTAEARREDARIREARDPAAARREAPLTRVARRLDHKYDGRGFFDGRRDHLFVVDAAGGDPLQLTDGDWEVEGYDWDVDGGGLVFVADLRADGDRLRDNQVARVNMSGGEPEVVATPGFYMQHPRGLPGGDTLVLAERETNAGGLYPDLFRIPRSGARPVRLTQDLACGDGVLSDMRATHGVDPVVHPDGTIYFQVTERGAVGVWSVAADGVARPVLGGERAIYDFDVAAGGVVAFAATTELEPGDVYLLRDGCEQRLTNVNGELLSQLRLHQPRRFSFQASDGLDIEGWLLSPRGENGQRPPLVLEVHGGPHGSYGHAFFHEFQMLAGAGTGVLYANPRGSVGYGEDFCRAVSRDWGGRDLQDLLSALDQVLAEGEFDEKRLGVAGGSYGGYMTGMLIGQTPRFRAAVAMRSVTNLISENGSSDISLWGPVEYGDPAVDLEDLWRRSPVGHAEKITTPLLLLHSEMDLRCSVGQADELFTVLRRLGREVQLVRFPEESHDLSRSGRPDRRVERLRLILDWFTRHLLEKATQVQEDAATPVDTAQTTTSPVRA